MPNAQLPISPNAPISIPYSTFALLSAFAAFAFTIIVPTMLRDGDTGWHLVAGAWIVAHAAVPTTDPFSFSVAGRPWIAHEWLSEVAMYASYRAGGWSGLIVLVGIAMATLFALVAAELRRWMGARASIVALLLLATGLIPSLVARPHMLVLPILAGWTIALLRAREQDRAPPLWVAAAMLIWANAHGSYVFGLALVGVFALEALLTAKPSDRLTVIQRWALFGIVATIAAAVTPWGVHGLTFPFYLNDLKALGQINEWQPSNFTTFSGFEAILLLSLAFLLARPIRIPPIRLLLVLGMLHMTLQHTRHEIILVTVGLLVLAKPLGRAWRSRDTSVSKRFTPSPDRLTIAVLISILAIGLTAYRVAVPVVRAETKGIPITALAHLPAPLRHQRVFNEYGFGGSLILAGIRPYIDGRTDMYGDAFTLDYFAIARGDADRWRAANAKWHFGWTILPPRSPLVSLLDHDPAWRRIYADDTAVIHQAVPRNRANR
ncbi:hypothetical protein C8J44_2453 [Sphingomonas sp. PP-CE-3A-406]|uniref:hypothetical protein n=1 Tax=Sphingomonas sp. PP-CE-3A-406 TaxID=2135659 RepID=UPI000EF97841|nr:hypothetical protein [Sphingomonas sp. PP-CE-3A-406]RMB51445.1 hypothetical protein C8J44_2453 [Sphingomonas sp. PP-CE-3A-406]